MSVRIGIDTDRLQADRSSVAQELAQIRSQLVQLRSDVEKMSQCWEGPAAAAYQARMTEDIEGALSVCGYLQEYLSCMERAQDAYSSCERRMEEAMAQAVVETF